MGPPVADQSFLAAVQETWKSSAAEDGVLPIPCAREVSLLAFSMNCSPTDHIATRQSFHCQRAGQSR
eukprot:1882124-Amphidinium_carterae.1